MGKRKKPRDPAAHDSPAPPPAPDRISRPFAAALKELAVKPATKSATAAAPPPAKPAAVALPPARPSAGYEERVALRNAFAGVTPLGGRARRVGDEDLGAGAQLMQRAREAGRSDARMLAAVDEAARARLANLVGDGIRFDIERDEDGRVSAARVERGRDALRALRRGGAVAEAQLDLHGFTADAAEAALLTFLREAHKRGRRIVRVVHGKGTHSEGGVGVLADRVLKVLIDGAGAPRVLALCTTDARNGGLGALLVHLARA